MQGEVRSRECEPIVRDRYHFGHRLTHSSTVSSHSSGDDRAMDTVNEAIRQHIHSIRGQRVLLDANLAALYGVETGHLVRAMKRNAERFPEDFVFQLSEAEIDALRSQTVTSKPKTPVQSEILLCQTGIARSHGGRRTLPYAFTDQGVAMLSSVLRSPQAIAVSVEIVRTFVQLRRLLATHADLTRKLDTLEQRYDAQFASVFEAIRQLMTPPPLPRRPLGFEAPDAPKP